MSEIAWLLKNKLTFSPRLKRKAQLVSIDHLLRSFTSGQITRHGFLSEQYDLSNWPSVCTKTEYIENLYLLDVLNRYLPSIPENGKGLDIGCRNFCHLPALSAFHSYAWMGVEIDCHARYWNGYTRKAYGEYMASQFPRASYRGGSLLETTGQFRMISWFLPFLFPETQSAWGLPTRYFDPKRMLAKALELLATNGVMLIVNQGQHEAEEQLRLLEDAGIEYKNLGCIESIFSPFIKPRYGWLVSGGV